LPKTVSDIYRKVKHLGISKEELETHLDEMDKKGSIFGIKKGKRKYYRTQILFVGIYEFQVNRVRREFMEDIVQYLDEAFANEMTSTGVYQARIVPVEKSIPYENFIYDYDNIRYLIKKVKGQIAVANCICRVGHDVMGQNCKQTNLRESCLLFRQGAIHFINHGRARPISKNEAIKILDEAEKSGLILQLTNAKQFYFICTCCKCCCEGLKSVLKTGYPAKLYRTNYYAEINFHLCVKCKTCINRCQTNALKIDKDFPVINLDKCIGCGLCITSCPKKAIQLKKKEKKYKPPKTSYKLYLSIMSKKFGKWLVIKTILTLILDLKLYYFLKKK